MRNICTGKHIKHIVLCVWDWSLTCPLQFRQHLSRQHLPCPREDFLNNQGLDSFLHLPVSSSPTSPTALLLFPRCPWQDGPKSLRTSALSSSAVASMTTRLALLVTMDSRSWLLLIPRRRPRSCRLSWPTADWPWWRSLACSFRRFADVSNLRQTMVFTSHHDLSWSFVL